MCSTPLESTPAFYIRVISMRYMSYLSLPSYCSEQKEEAITPLLPNHTDIIEKLRPFNMALLHLCWSVRDNANTHALMSLLYMYFLLIFACGARISGTHSVIPLRTTWLVKYKHYRSPWDPACSVPAVYVRGWRPLLGCLRAKHQYRCTVFDPRFLSYLQPELCQYMQVYFVHIADYIMLLAACVGRVCHHIVTHSYSTMILHSITVLLAILFFVCMIWFNLCSTFCMSTMVFYASAILYVFCYNHTRIAGTCLLSHYMSVGVFPACCMWTEWGYGMPLTSNLPVSEFKVSTYRSGIPPTRTTCAPVMTSCSEMLDIFCRNVQTLNPPAMACHMLLFDALLMYPPSAPHVHPNSQILATSFSVKITLYEFCIYANSEKLYEIVHP